MDIWLEDYFKTHDGLSIFYRYKKPEIETNNSLLILHRGHEHSGRVMESADRISENKYWCFSFDIRGHGQSEGERAWAQDFDVWVQDLNSFVGHIYSKHGLQTSDMVLLANSVGSVTAVSWIINYAPNLKGCILAAPAFSIKLYIPLALPALRLAKKFSDKLFVTSYVNSSLLTRDELQAKRYDDDELITKKIGVNILVSLFDDVKRCFKRLNEFETPVLLVSAGNDYIVKNTYHDRFFEQISSTTKKHIRLDKFRHAVFHEKEQDLLLQPCKAFINEQFSQELTHLPMVVPQPSPYSVEEYKKLLEPASKVEQIGFGVFRWVLERFGKNSRGISIGLTHGFDSGLSLDYVYKNQAEGTGLFGHLIDKIYLKSIGWKKIRLRKKNLKETLLGVMALQTQQNTSPVVLDIASGAGRYLVEAKHEFSEPVSLYLNDIDTATINQAKQLAQEHALTDVFFSNENVFNPSHQWAISPRPNIIIISGLFELYQNNQQVHGVLRKLFDLLDEGGYIIYTGQPWHPQMEMIARLLNNRVGERWVMRRRVQREMDELISASGFTKRNTVTDNLGIFTVSLAQKGK